MADAPERLEVRLQPLGRLEVEVVGRLVQQQQVRRAHQQLRQRDPRAPAAGELGRRACAGRPGRSRGRPGSCGSRPRRGSRRAPRSGPAPRRGGRPGDRVSSSGSVAVQRALDLGRPRAGAASRSAWAASISSQRVRSSWTPASWGRYPMVQPLASSTRPRVRLLDATHDPQQRRLAGAVRPDQGDLFAGRDGQRDVVQDRARTIAFCEVDQS